MQNASVPATSQWIAFLVASILFIQVPGPSLLFTIGRALTVGRRDALVTTSSITSADPLPDDLFDALAQII